MRTVTVDVGGMISVLSARGIEKQLTRLPGVHHAEVNYVAGSATVMYDETRTDLKTIKARVDECGYHCAGALTARHVCVPEDPPSAAAMVAPGDQATHAGHAATEPVTTQVLHHEMAHEMGHDAGMDMQAMARDMRNRFWVALVFSVPIFVYSPMGAMFTPPTPPFALPLNFWLFVLASAAVIYPVWPFAVAAWRALKNGVLNMAVLVILSVGTGYLFSVGATFFFEGVQFYEIGRAHV